MKRGWFRRTILWIHLALGLSASLVLIVIALTGALRRKGGSLIRAVAIVFSSAPTFLLGLGAILLFYRHFHWLPAGGRTKSATEGNGWVLLRSIFTGKPSRAWDALRHLLMPALALALPIAATFERLQAQAMSDTIQQPFILSALARGVPRRQLLVRHAWRASLRSICAVYGLAIATLFSGSFVVEYIAAWPGLGRLMYEALRARDIYLVAGCAAAGALFLAIRSEEHTSELQSH